MFSERKYDIDLFFAKDPSEESVKFIHLTEKKRRKLNFCCLDVMETVKAANI